MRPISNFGHPVVLSWGLLNRAHKDDWPLKHLRVKRLRISLRGLRVVKIRLKVLGDSEERELLLPDVEAKAEELFKTGPADLLLREGDEVSFERARDKARRGR
jgi:hypothetical protein